MAIGIGRRQFISALGGATVAWPRAARAQQGSMPVIGVLSGQSPEISESQIAAFRQGVQETGFVEGRDVTIDSRWARNNNDRLPALAAELVQLRVSVIAAIAFGSTPAALAAKAATSGIPIVFAVGTDPIKTGIVSSLNRPSGNVTGATFFANELAAKRLGLLHELLPQATMIAVLMNQNFTDAADQLKDIQDAARALGLKTYVVSASTEHEIDGGFAAVVRQRADALFVGADPFLSSRQDQIVELARRNAVPAIYDLRQATAAGGLISYAASSLDTQRLAGVYAGRILKGEKTTDLPVLQPTKFELVINLKTAKALGLTVPPSLLALADEVIE
jgi:putative tryptophan/tyrosine transport system substrate-binding protein